MNPSDEMKIHQTIARAIYVSGSPLSILHHPLWKEALNLLNPTYVPPSRKVLATTLLDREYAEVHSDVTEKIRESDILHLAIDGWPNLRNESILNVVIYGPKPYFYKFIETKTESHTAEYLCEEISKVIEDFGTEKFFGVITDNAANMLRCGRLLKEKYNNILWFGCLAHTLHLMVNDILKIPIIRNLFAFIVDVTKTVIRSHTLKAEFNKISEEKSIHTSLSLPGKTRWGSYLQTLENFYKCRIILQNLVINVNNPSLSRHRTKLLNETVWDNMEKVQKIITPIVKWITKLEGDYCTVHLVYKALTELDNLLIDPIAIDFFKEDLNTLVEKFQERKINSLKPIHFAASILDPQSQGAQLNSDENISGCEVIFNLTETSNQDQLAEDLTNYKCRRGNWGKDFLWKMVANIEPLTWWQSLFPKTVLGRTACKILSVPATSAAVERSFSTFSNIHTQKRNRLKTDRAGKITFISHNWKIRNRSTNNVKTSTPSNSMELTSPVSSSSESNSEDRFSDVIPSNNEELFVTDVHIPRPGGRINDMFSSDSE